MVAKDEAVHGVGLEVTDREELDHGGEGAAPRFLVRRVLAVLNGGDRDGRDLLGRGVTRERLPLRMVTAEAVAEEDRAMGGRARRGEPQPKRHLIGRHRGDRGRILSDHTVRVPVVPGGEGSVALRPRRGGHADEGRVEGVVPRGDVRRDGDGLIHGRLGHEGRDRDQLVCALDGADGDEGIDGFCDLGRGRRDLGRHLRRRFETAARGVGERAGEIDGGRGRRGEGTHRRQDRRGEVITEAHLYGHVLGAVLGEDDEAEPAGGIEGRLTGRNGRRVERAAEAEERVGVNAEAVQVREVFGEERQEPGAAPRDLRKVLLDEAQALTRHGGGIVHHQRGLGPAGEVSVGRRVEEIRAGRPGVDHRVLATVAAVGAGVTRGSGVVAASDQEHEEGDDERGRRRGEAWGHHNGSVRMSRASWHW